MPKIDLPDISNLITDDEGTDPRDHISLRLLDLVRFDIPDRLVKEELALDGISGGEPGSRVWKAVSDRIKLMLILKQIARREGVEVDEKDVNNRIAEKAREFGTTRKSLQIELEKGDGTQRLKDMLLAESTLEYLIERES
jgi:FKBP-type peptidyl-prolyl cis-trans isomerase (trigger factor)